MVKKSRPLFGLLYRQLFTIGEQVWEVNQNAKENHARLWAATIRDIWKRPRSGRTKTYRCSFGTQEGFPGNKKEMAWIASPERVRTWMYTKWWENVHGFFLCTEDILVSWGGVTDYLRGWTNKLDEGKWNTENWIHLDKRVRRECETVCSLSDVLYINLQARPAEKIFGCDASLEGYYLVCVRWPWLTKGIQPGQWPSGT